MLVWLTVQRRIRYPQRTQKEMISESSESTQAVKISIQTFSPGESLIRNVVLTVD